MDSYLTAYITTFPSVEDKIYLLSAGPHDFTISLKDTDAMEGYSIMVKVVHGRFHDSFEAVLPTNDPRMISKGRIPPMH